MTALPTFGLCDRRRVAHWRNEAPIAGDVLVTIRGGDRCRHAQRSSFPSGASGADDKRRWLAVLGGAESRGWARALAFLLFCLLAATPLRAPAEVDAADAQEIVERLLGLPPTRHETPLAAMQGWGELYRKYRDAAAAGDAAALRVWLLIGQAAADKADASTMQAFTADLMRVYIAQRDALLTALAENGWLVNSACFYLGNWFAQEERQPEDRPDFLETEAPRIATTLQPVQARTCLGQIVAPSLPMPPR
jgi:hypothetical protein